MHQGELHSSCTQEQSEQPGSVGGRLCPVEDRVPLVSRGELLLACWNNSTTGRELKPLARDKPELYLVCSERRVVWLRELIYMHSIGRRTLIRPSEVLPILPDVKTI